MKEMLNITTKKISIKNKFKKMKKSILMNGKKEQILLKKLMLIILLSWTQKIENLKLTKFLNGLLFLFTDNLN